MISRAKCGATTLERFSCSCLSSVFEVAYPQLPDTRSPDSQDSLYPRAHTCFNKLDLPMYDNQAELEARLSFVINAELTGFTME